MKMKELHSIEAVIFDLDGTLMDSMWLWEAIDIEYLGRYGYQLPKDLQKSIEGMGFTETACYFKERFQIPDSIETIKAEWNKMAYQKYAEEVPLKKGALSLLQYLKEHNYKIAIASSNSHTLIDACLTSNHAKEYFDLITISCEVAHGKPYPDIYLKASADLGVSPEHCLVFEDVPMGILAGKRAGMTVIAIEDDFSSDQKETILRMADHYICSFEEALELLGGIEKK